MKPSFRHWRWLLAGAAFLLGGVERNSTPELVIAFAVLSPLAKVSGERAVVQ
jgi:hypothetical protein